jgi:hypothetical protein
MLRLGSGLQICSRGAILPLMSCDFRGAILPLMSCCSRGAILPLMCGSRGAILPLMSCGSRRAILLMSCGLQVVTSIFRSNESSASAQLSYKIPSTERPDNEVVRSSEALVITYKTTTQNTTIDIFTSVRTSNLKLLLMYRKHLYWYWY